MSSPGARESRGGWTPELASRALAGLRIAGSYATGRAVGQRPVTGGDRPMDGELAIGGGFGRPGALVCGSVTCESVNAIETPTTRGLADALRALTVGRYGRSEDVTKGADEALDTAIRIGRERNPYSVGGMVKGQQSLVNA